MNKINTLDQSLSVDAKALNHASTLQTQSESKSTNFERLRYFALSVPDFRRTNKGSIRHRLCDIIMLMILSRARYCAGERTQSRYCIRILIQHRYHARDGGLQRKKQ